MKRRHTNKGLPQGIVLLALLLTLGLMGIALMGAAVSWSVERQREAEADLLFVGDQYRRAIERYYYASPGGAKALPSTLDELVEDKRFPVPVRHLRRAYPDPMTGADFAVLRTGDQINGVASTSGKSALKRSGFVIPYKAFEASAIYSQWKFIFQPSLPASTRPMPIPSSKRSLPIGVKP